MLIAISKETDEYLTKGQKYAILCYDEKSVFIKIDINGEAFLLNKSKFNIVKEG